MRTRIRDYIAGWAEIALAVLVSVTLMLLVSDRFTDFAKAQGPKVEVNPSPTPDLSGVTEGDIIKTMEHRDELAKQRIAELTAERNGLKKQVADLSKSGTATGVIVKTSPDEIKSIDATNAAYSHLWWKDLWDKWKWTIFGFFLGIIVAIAAFLFTKAAVVVTSVAAKLGIKAVVA